MKNKRLIANILTVMLCLGLAACGSKGPEPTDEEKVVVELAGVEYATSSGGIVLKITFSAKNNCGGVIDTAAYFEYNEDKVFSDLYQSKIDMVCSAFLFCDIICRWRR